MKIDCEKLGRLLKQHVSFNLIDVRATSEFQKGHIPGAKNFPFDVFLNKLQGGVTQKEAAIVIYDNKEEHSGVLVTKAENLGYINIVSLEGGYQAFLKSQSA